MTFTKSNERYEMPMTTRPTHHRAPLIVPERVFLTGGGSDKNGSASAASPVGGMIGLLVNLLVAEKSGFQLGLDGPELSNLRTFAEKIAADAAPSGVGEVNRQAQHIRNPSKYDTGHKSTRLKHAARLSGLSIGPPPQRENERTP